MSTPRRRLVRPALSTTLRPRPDRQLQKLRTRLETERAALARWQTKLRRAFNSVAKFQKSITRIERQLARLEESA